MMVLRKVFILMLLVMTACSPSPSLLTPPPTEAASATPTPTQPASLPTTNSNTLTKTDPELEKAIVQASELPEDISAQSATSLPPLFMNMPATTKIAYRELKRGALAAGDVAIFRYDSVQLAELGYQTLIKDFTGDVQVVKDLGDQAKAVPVSRQLQNAKLEFVDIVFRRCNHVVHVRLAGSTDLSNAMQIAQKIDARLSAYPCP